MSGPYGAEHWRIERSKIEAQINALPKWRWFKRSNLREAHRTIVQVERHELAVELDELKRKLGRED